MNGRRRALVIYARPPIAGRVKTRLQPVITDAEALVLYEAMLLDSIERFPGGEHGAELFLSWAGPTEGVSPAVLSAASRVRVEYQLGDDLGERMAHTIDGKLRAGFGEVVLVGADTPHLPLDYLDQAFEALAAVDLVIGPSTDGGYYLIGTRKLHRNLFRQIPWSGGRVLEETRERIRAGRVLHHELRAWYDLDRPADLSRLLRDLAGRSPRAEDLPVRTADALSRIAPSRLAPDRAI